MPDIQVVTGSAAMLLNEKYPRTYHFPFSPGATNDDRIQDLWFPLLEQEIVLTEKLDGENTCLKASGVYARSHGDINRNPWARPIWEIWEQVGRSLDDLHLFGENLYAVHSIEYERLSNYFFVFAVRDGAHWLSWEDVCAYAQILELPVVPELFRGRLAPAELPAHILRLMEQGSQYGGPTEGVVCRNAAAFSDAEFSNNVLKYVRKNHVQTDEHWTKNWKKAVIFQR